MNRVALDLGFIQIYWYSLFIFLGMLAACFAVFREAKRRNVDEDFLVNLIFNTIIISIIGARLYYVVFNLDYYLVNPTEILEIWNGGLAIHGGMLAAVFFIYHYCEKHKVDFIRIFDIAVVGLFIGQAIGRWGNFFNGEAYGAITSYDSLYYAGIPKFVINGMYILGNYRQPTFFYESMWCLFGFAALIIFRQYKYLKKGQLTGLYMIWYGTVRVLIEAQRADSLMLGEFKIAQLVSLLFIVLGGYLFVRYMDNKKYSGEEYDYRYIPIEKEQEVVLLD